MSSHERLFSKVPVRNGQFRLLDILPAPHGSDPRPPMRCELRIALLSHRPDYEAISYVWGSQTPENEIQIEVSGQVFNTTKNLHAALSRFRLKDKTRTIWVDQICINQADSAEKSMIVPLMRQIYSQCRQCLFWAGEIPREIGVPNMESLFELLAHLAMLGKTDTATPPRCVASQTTFFAPMSALEWLLDGQDCWFSRIWTVQEAVLPKKAVLLCGPLSISWDTLDEAVRTFTRPQGLPTSLRRLCESRSCPLHRFIEVLAWLYNSKGRCETWAAMEQWRGRRAHDPRDKVYALLGLFPPGALPTVERCNYEISAAEVYENLTVDLIFGEQSLRPLIGHPRLEEDRATPNLAKWAIDLKERPTWGIEFWHQRFDSYFFRADKGRRMVVQHKRGMLGLRGIFVDTIQQVEPGLKILDADITPEGLIESLKRWQSTTTNEEAFGRLIINDVIRDTYENPTGRATKKEADYAVGYLRYNESSAYLHIGILKTVKNSVFFTTKSGLIGRGHLDTQVGDEVWVFDGGSVPFTVRPRSGSTTGGNDPEYDFVAHSYVHGIMDGEAYESGIETQFVWIR